MIDLKSVRFGYYNKAKRVEEGLEMVPQIKFDPSLIEDNDLYYFIDVKSWQAMRIDLIISSIYGDTVTAMEAIDVILTLNGIDNPLNIKEGTRIYYPKNIDSIDNYRVPPEELPGEARNPLAVLGKANKNTKIDPKRAAFVKNGYSLPPTVNRTPINPVRVESGNLLAGGVK